MFKSTFEELSELISQYPITIPVHAVAQFLHIKEAGLRAAMDQQRCPFGFSWKLGNRGSYHIPTATFVNWFTRGVALEDEIKTILMKEAG